MKRREQDIMRRLADARPERLDPARPVDPGDRIVELTAALNQQRVSDARSRRPGRRLRPRWGVGLVSAAAAAAVVATLVAESGDQGPGGRPDGSEALEGAASGRAFLLAAAERQEKADDGGEGEYWHRRTLRGQMNRIPGEDGRPGYTVDDRSVDREWLASAEYKRWSRTDDRGARPATPKDEQAWREAGSPREWNLPGQFDLSYEGRGLIDQDAPGGDSDSGPMGDISIKNLRTLPTEEKALRKRLRELVDKEYNAPEWHLRELVVWKAKEVAISMPATPAQRAAAYRLIAAEPDVRSVGRIKDWSGREGYGVAWSSKDGYTEQRLVLDGENGSPLGTLHVALRDAHGSKKGDVLSYSVTAERGWTDTPPPFDEDEQPDWIDGPIGEGAEPEPQPLGKEAKAAEDAGAEQKQRG